MQYNCRHGNRVALPGGPSRPIKAPPPTSPLSPQISDKRKVGGLEKSMEGKGGKVIDKTLS